jgi:Domain of unknown function DUF29
MSETTVDDRYAWAIDTARRLRAGEPVNAVEVAEEIEQMGRSDARELDSRITQILEHLLKLRLVRGALLDHNSRGWQASIARQRGEIQSLLDESPSLKRRITVNLVEKCYRNATGVVAAEYEVEPPDECPFSPDDVLTGI